MPPPGSPNFSTVSYAEQAQLYRDYRNGTGNLAAPPARAPTASACPPTSTSPTPNPYRARDNAGRYGFVNDVPSEPWHWTYKKPLA
jgi:hypothetical protein